MSSDVILHEFHCSNQVSVRRPKQFPICIQPFQNDISVWCRRLRPAFHLCVSVCARDREREIRTIEQCVNQFGVENEDVWMQEI